jgi:hypothetical protein
MPRLLLQLLLLAISACFQHEGLLHLPSCS